MADDSNEITVFSSNGKIILLGTLCIDTALLFIKKHCLPVYNSCFFHNTRCYFRLRLRDLDLEAQTLNPVVLELH
jgi:hypothetical protein